MSSHREFDVVLWGATGAVGRRVAHHLATRNKTCGLQWAIGGRNEAKLKAVGASLPESAKNIPIVIGDNFDRASLDALVARTRVVCSTVGPFAKFGSELVAACATSGTHYCDISGEVHWMRRMIDTHQAEAERSGARIVPACGFDSVPSDLGVFLLQSRAQAQYGKVCHHVRMRVTTMRGGFSGGTAASGVYAAEQGRRDPSISRFNAEPYALNPKGERSGPDRPDKMMPFEVKFDPHLNGWTMPFFMSPINNKIVRRSNALLNYRYGKEFRYEEAIFTGPGPFGWILATTGVLGARVFLTAMAMAPTRNLLKRYVLPKSGEGPGRETRENSTYEIVQLGILDDSTSMRVRLRGKGDPGVESTSRILVEAALCLAEDGDRMAVSGGFWTPASAMGDLLLSRLGDHAGLTFEIVNDETIISRTSGN